MTLRYFEMTWGEKLVTMACVLRACGGHGKPGGHKTLRVCFKPEIWEGFKTRAVRHAAAEHDAALKVYVTRSLIVWNWYQLNAYMLESDLPHYRLDLPTTEW